MGVTRYLNRVRPPALAALEKHPILLELLTELDGERAALEELLELDDLDDAETWGASRDDIAGFLAAPGVSALRCVLDPYEDFDKSWAGIHFVLTGKDAMTQESATTPLELALVGGRALAGTSSTVPPHIVDARDVAAVARALADVGDFVRRVDLCALRSASIYPQIWDEAEAKDYLATYFDDLKRVYRAAAERGDAMLVRTSV